MIKVYSKADCAQCIATTKYLEKLELEYELLKVDEDEDALKAVLDMGYKTMPVVVVVLETLNEKETLSWCGFRPDQIHKLKALV